MKMSTWFRKNAHTLKATVTDETLTLLAERGHQNPQKAVEDRIKHHMLRGESPGGVIQVWTSWDGQGRPSQQDWDTCVTIDVHYDLNAEELNEVLVYPFRPLHPEK